MPIQVKAATSNLSAITLTKESEKLSKPKKKLIPAMSI